MYHTRRYTPTIDIPWRCATVGLHCLFLLTATTAGCWLLWQAPIGEIIHLINTGSTAIDIQSNAQRFGYILISGDTPPRVQEKNGVDIIVFFMAIWPLLRCALRPRSSVVMCVSLIGSFLALRDLPTYRILAMLCRMNFLLFARRRVPDYWIALDALGHFHALGLCHETA